MVFFSEPQCFFFNLLMDSGWPASLGRFRQISNQVGRHYFKELLKLQRLDINVATPSPPSPQQELLSFFGDFKMTNPLRIGSEGFSKVENLAIYRQEK
jgi:hypothetical protein